MRRRGILIFVAVVMVVASTVIIHAVIKNTVSRHDFAGALISNCHRDLRYKEQYRRRAVVERRSLKIQARANATLAEVSSALAHGPDRQANELLLRLARIEQDSSRSLLKLRRSIHIIPLAGYCAQIRAAARN